MESYAKKQLLSNFSAEYQMEDGKQIKNYHLTNNRYIWKKSKMRKISVISGGSGGLGLEIADLLIKSGNNVLVLGRNIKKLCEAENRLRTSAKNNFAGSLVCNIGNEEETKKFSDKKHVFS
jgi:pyruvate/2-oxoglutarate dehydrogenase complex dihydrolipoamide dehydrogenase (E3) component